MESEFSVFIALAAVAFAAAILGVIVQWLKADDAAATAEAGVRIDLAKLAPHADARQHVSYATSHADAAWPHAVPEAAAGKARDAGAAPDEAAAVDEAKPVTLADNETALSRLFFGWGGAGMVLGLVVGGVLYGTLGALLGAVLLSTASIGAVVIGVLIVSRIRKSQARKSE